MKKYLVTRYISRLFHYLRALNAWNERDILLASFPKSGNTWVRYFWINYISQAEWGGQIIDFKTLDNILPSFGLSNFFVPWKYKSLPRAVASHLKYGFYFKVPKNVLIVRDPRDVMVSYFHYANSKKRLPDFDNFVDFIHDGRYGLEAWFRHYASWQGKADIVLKYEDIKEDDVREFKRMLGACNIEYNEEWLQAAAIASRFDKLKSIEEKKGHSKSGSENKSGFKFARKGEIGDYLNYFGESDILFYKKLCKKYNIYLYD